MIWGILSDTHDIDRKVIEHLIVEFKRRNVEVIIHSGDIEPQHLDPELFGNLPVVCALTEHQVDKSEFQTPPAGWVFTHPGKRVIYFGGKRIYVGHKMSFEFLIGSEQELEKTLQKISHEYDGVRWLFSGHSHRQAEIEGDLVTFINPGAIQDASDGNYEFAIVDPEIKQVVFSRISRTKDQRKPVSVGVISDSFDISKRDPSFWGKLADEFRQRDVSSVIHCGNILPGDIGKQELADFEVYYNLRSDQRNPGGPNNWHFINPDHPVVDIADYRFYVELELGAKLLGESEFTMREICLRLRKKYSGIHYVLCGFTRNSLYEEGSEVRIVNPGDIVNYRNFVVLCLPRNEITLGRVPVDLLPTFSET